MGFFSAVGILIQILLKISCLNAKQVAVPGISYVVREIGLTVIETKGNKNSYYTVFLR